MFGARNNENYPEPKNLATLRGFFGIFPLDDVIDVIRCLKALSLIISDHDFMDDASFESKLDNVGISNIMKDK